MQKTTFSFVCVISTFVALFLFCSCSKKHLATIVLTPNQAPAITATDVFFNSTDGYNTYRIPAIVMAPDSSILAFIEGKVNNSADFGNVKILMKKSMDNGKTWGASLLMAENGFAIDYGASAYSDLIILPGQRIGVLYEENTNNTIRFSSFDYKNIPNK